MPLIDENGRSVPDPWHLLADSEELPEAGAVLLPLSRWLAERDRLKLRTELNGVLLRSSESITAIVEDLPYIDLIVVEFPKFTDGRPYSTARLLRERYRYTRELRAAGNVLRDQLQSLLRCGFDSFVLSEDHIGNLDECFGEMSIVYQAAADARSRAATLRGVDRTGYQQSKICVGFWAY